MSTREIYALSLELLNDREHNKGSKIYPQNQVILDCIMSSISLNHLNTSV